MWVGDEAPTPNPTLYVPLEQYDICSITIKYYVVNQVALLLILKTPFKLRLMSKYVFVLDINAVLSPKL